MTIGPDQTDAPGLGFGVITTPNPLGGPITSLIKSDRGISNCVNYNGRHHHQYIGMGMRDRGDDLAAG